ncbi:MAG: helix-turn-helix domain-containing protein [Nitrososphaerota archaeon]
MRARSVEDDAAFKGLGAAVRDLREARAMTREELAGAIEEEPPILRWIEAGEVDADWGTLRVLAQALGLPLETMLELAEEAAPGEGGEQWRSWSREAARSIGDGSGRDGRRGR